jgi:hypothetical protein
MSAGRVPVAAENFLSQTVDPAVTRFMNEPAASPWARADLLSDGRHNSPAGVTSLGTTHIRWGLSLRVDLDVHPDALADG